ncbi:carbohydrate sulfotransferase 11-like [Ylistrum balloti]|uniref:carbohydrate sulfotransferase 11-like n=1 Tax=Ylistrum balloti TaxID=509963 RepID=UPI002905A8F8|nr:carbohydrate sulfotransferase 11-like [Ylistrum balloti]
MVFCYIPKISCSQWKTLFITLTGKVNASLLNFGNVHTRYRSKMTYLGEYSIEKRHSILQKYKKYIVVRNPFERLLSAFRNKFANKVNYYEPIAKKIIKQYRSNATKESDDVTFFEFVQYITDGKTRYYDPHWNRYTTLCRPCFVKYDFVGKYETIARDAEFILRDFGAPPEIKFPKRSEKYQSVETIKTFNKYYSQIPAEYIAKLWNIYRLDFEAFGYSVSDNLNTTNMTNFSCWNVFTHTRCLVTSFEKSRRASTRKRPGWSNSGEEEEDALCLSLKPNAEEPLLQPFLRPKS